MANKPLQIGTVIITNIIPFPFVLYTLDQMHDAFRTNPGDHMDEICYLALYVQGELYRSTIQVTPKDIDNKWLGIITGPFTHYVVMPKDPWEPVGIIKDEQGLRIQSL